MLKKKLADLVFYECLLHELLVHRTFCERDEFNGFMRRSV